MREVMKDIALIMVDVQNDFCPIGGALPVPHGDEVVPMLNRVSLILRKKGGWVFASRCWHPATTRHFDHWPPHCIQGTDGANFHPDLDLTDVTIISKGMGPDENAYSALQGVDSDGQSLLWLLKEYYRVGFVFVGGLATDYCVKATALDAVHNGFTTVFLPDASRAVNRNPHDKAVAIQEMVDEGVVVFPVHLFGL